MQRKRTQLAIEHQGQRHICNNTMGISPRVCKHVTTLTSQPLFFKARYNFATNVRVTVSVDKFLIGPDGVATWLESRVTNLDCDLRHYADKTIGFAGFSNNSSGRCWSPCIRGFVDTKCRVNAKEGYRENLVCRQHVLAPHPIDL